MQYAEQPTPPFNSPYQTHASRGDSLLETPYLSPSRHDPMARYPQGLGLYNYHHQLPTNLPPSPAPSESWSGHVSTGASPLMTQAIADPYASGAFDHPIIRSPQPWDNSQLSPRSSVSSATIVPVHSHPGSDNTYHEMTREMRTVNLGNQGWCHDACYTHNDAVLPSSRHQPLTVSPERLDNTILPYGNPYGATQVSRMDASPGSEYENQVVLRESSERSSAHRPSYPQVPAHKEPARIRRHTNPATAAFVCTICSPQKGFARHYNFKQHMETHNPNRPKPYVCPYEDCPRAFVRNTDLKRHHISVHSGEKDHKCDKCDALFSRKDTCTRHIVQGCTRRAQLSNSDAFRARYHRSGRYRAVL